MYIPQCTGNQHSLELTVFQEKRSIIHRGILHNVQDIASRAFARYLIPDRVCEDITGLSQLTANQRTDKLLSELQSRIVVDGKALTTFLHLLSQADACYEPLVRSISEWVNVSCHNYVYLCIIILCSAEAGIVYNYTQGKWPVRTGIGRTQPAIDGRCTCTVCVPFQSVCVPLQSVLGTHRGYVPVVKVVPIRNETVRKRCKYGVRLEQAGSVLYPCVRAMLPVIVADQHLYMLATIMHVYNYTY